MKDVFEDARRIIGHGLQRMNELPATSETYFELDQALLPAEHAAARGVGEMLFLAYGGPEDEPRTAADIEVHLAVVKAQKDFWDKRQTALKKEHGEALVREAPTHPLLGQEVQRTITSYGFSGSPRNQFGTMMQNTGLYPKSVKGGPWNYSVPPGGFYVATPGGTYYDTLVDNKRTEWVAREKKGKKS